MKKIVTAISACLFLLAACVKDNTPAFDGAYLGKIKSINTNQWTFKYTEDGLLAEYKYNLTGVVPGTATLTWESGQVTCADGIGYTYTRPRNALGYATPGSGDQQSGNSWTYDSLHQVISLNGINYYWSNGNIDSLALGMAVAIYEYSSDLDTRDYGAAFVPLLTHFPIYNLRIKNLPSKITQLNPSGDTVSIRHYTYEFDSLGRIGKETENLEANGMNQVVGQKIYTYYE